jgi:3-oxoacyl-[acyl-carrier-protein] synthase II
VIAAIHSDPHRRAVITGFGVVSALGIGQADFWAGLQSQRSPVRRITQFDTSLTQAKHAAWIDDWQASDWLPGYRAKRMDRCTQFSVVAALQAVADAGLDLHSGARHANAGIAFGTAVGGFGHGEQQYLRLLSDGPSALNPALALQLFPASAHGQIAIEFGLEGPGTTNTNSCAAGNAAIGDALRLIQAGKAQIMLAGAGECPITPMIFTTFDRTKTMSAWDQEPAHAAYRPYSRHRDGFVMGEGAAMFVMESLAHARARGARIHAEVLGFACGNEASHMSTPEPSGRVLRRTLQQALDDAGLRPDQIDYVNAHASGTPVNDDHELRQIVQVFGAHAAGLAVSGTKPYTGHTLGAASALELATCLLARQHHWLPPTLNLTDPDPACASVRLISEPAAPQALRHVLSIALGFGGIDTALVFGDVRD